MILITGGSFQGKKAYTMDLFGIMEHELVDGATCPLDALYEAKAVAHFHEYLKRLLGQGDAPEPSAFVRKLAEKNPQLILISNELGCGVVPIEKFDREYREYTGRVCCEIAKRASQVHRVVCGIGTVIKDA